jgi:hypothetical protein
MFVRTRFRKAFHFRSCLVSTSFHIFPSRKLSFSASQNAFQVLGLPPGSPYDKVKRAFVKLALEKHPDQEGGSAEAFIAIRGAYEAIRKEISVEDSSENHADDPSAYWSPAELQEWFQRETGAFLSFEMCDKTRKEVINVYKTMSHGGKDKGGYWDMARTLAEQEERRMASGTRERTGGLPSQLIGPQSSTFNRRRRKR